MINPLGPVLHTFTLLPSLRLLAPDPGLPTLTTLPLGLTLLFPQLLLGLSLSHLSTLLLLFNEATAAAAEAFFGKEALRTQLSKLDTKVSSPAAIPTPTRTLLQTVVEGEAALYREAEVICLLIGIGETDEDELAEGVVIVVAAVEQLKDSSDCCRSCCCRSCCGCRRIRLVRGRETTTRYRVRPARNDSSLTAILSVSSGRSR